MAGERVGIVGPSGAGKSTIVRLLSRLYEPQSGVIRIGGHDLCSLSPDQVRRLIAVVSQDTYLFHGTVEDNLRLGAPEASEAEMMSAAKAADAHDFIASLPQGFQSVIGERGMQLSGGRRQRLALRGRCCGISRSSCSIRRFRRAIENGASSSRRWTDYGQACPFLSWPIACPAWWAPTGSSSSRTGRLSSRAITASWSNRMAVSRPHGAAIWHRQTSSRLSSPQRPSGRTGSDVGLNQRPSKTQPR